MKKALEKLCARLAKKYKQKYWRVLDLSCYPEPAIPDLTGNPIGITVWGDHVGFTKLVVGFANEPIEEDNDVGQTETTMLVLSNTGYFKPEKVFYFFGRGSLSTGSSVDWQLDECGELKCL